MGPDSEYYARLCSCPNACQWATQSKGISSKDRIPRSRLPEALSKPVVQTCATPVAVVHRLRSAQTMVLLTTAYKDVLTLWKDADPDIPILKEAKTEYAKLQ